MDSLPHTAAPALVLVGQYLGGDSATLLAILSRSLFASSPRIEGLWLGTLRPSGARSMAMEAGGLLEVGVVHVVGTKEQLRWQPCAQRSCLEDTQVPPATVAVNPGGPSFLDRVPAAAAARIRAVSLAFTCASHYSDHPQVSPDRLLGFGSSLTRLAELHIRLGPCRIRTSNWRLLADPLLLLVRNTSGTLRILDVDAWSCRYAWTSSAWTSSVEEGRILMFFFLFLSTWHGNCVALYPVPPSFTFSLLCLFVLSPSCCTFIHAISLYLRTLWCVRYFTFTDCVALVRNVGAALESIRLNHLPRAATQVCV